MKKYSNKSNAKRGAVSAIVKERGVSKEEVLANPDQYFVIEGNKEDGFYPHFKTERVGGVSVEKEAELKEERSQGGFIDKGFVAKSPGMLTAAIVQHDNKGIKIEKNRPEQNDIVKPSKGGKCRQIWDLCDAYYEENGCAPKPKQIKAITAELGLSPVTTVIQMYQWRKFTGH